MVVTDGRQKLRNAERRLYERYGLAPSERFVRLADPPMQVRVLEAGEGPPEIGLRAIELMPDARLERMPGDHAPFLDDPERCARLILDSSGTTRARNPSLESRSPPT